MAPRSIMTRCTKSIFLETPACVIYICENMRNIRAVLNWLPFHNKMRISKMNCKYFLIYSKKYIVKLKIPMLIVFSYVGVQRAILGRVTLGWVHSHSGIQFYSILSGFLSVNWMPECTFSKHRTYIQFTLSSAE